MTAILGAIPIIGPSLAVLGALVDGLTPDGESITSSLLRLSAAVLVVGGLGLAAMVVAVRVVFRVLS